MVSSMPPIRKINKSNFISEDLRKKISLLGFALIILYVIVCIIWPSNSRHNWLNLDEASNNDLNISIYSLRQFDNISKATLTDLRASYFDNLPGLIDGTYKISESVFGKISDNAPWLSEQSYFFYGSDDQLHPGAAAEDLGLANPLLLINPDFVGWSIRDSLKWNRDLVLKQDALSMKDFPLYPKPKILRLKPGNKEIDVTYDLSEYQSLTRPWLHEALKVEHLTFIPVTYNAKDFGYAWLQLSSESSNLDKPSFELYPISVTSVRHLNINECGALESGCNMRMALGQVPPIKVSKLPSEALFNLWINRPSNPQQEPDLKYKIFLK